MKVACAVAALAAMLGVEGPKDGRVAFRARRIEAYLPSAMRGANLDLWLVLTRENNRDPLSLEVGAEHVVARGAFLFRLEGAKVLRKAIVASYDTAAVEACGIYDEVVAYGSEGLKPHLAGTLRAWNPKKIGVNSSREEPILDGLSVGLLDYLKESIGPELSARIVSAEEAVVSFRSRKLTEEIALLREGVALTERLLAEALSPKVVTPGKTTERDVADYLHRRMRELGVGPSWESDQCPNVTAGPQRGHSAPTDRVIERGAIVTIDFGINDRGYCTDVQRSAYVLRDGEAEPPSEIRRIWSVVLEANRAGIAAMKPGATGLEVDKAARAAITKAGYEEYVHAAGHPIGFFTHDLGPILGPDWPERYGEKVRRRLEVGQTFAMEPSATFTPEGGEGPIGPGLEEDVVVTERGAEYPGAPQTELILIP